MKFILKITQLFSKFGVAPLFQKDFSHMFANIKAFSIKLEINYQHDLFTLQTFYFENFLSKTSILKQINSSQFYDVFSLI